MELPGLPVARAERGGSGGGGGGDADIIRVLSHAAHAGRSGGGPAAISIDVALYRENRFNKLEHYVLEQYQASLLH